MVTVGAAILLLAENVLVNSDLCQEVEAVLFEPSANQVIALPESVKRLGFAGRGGRSHGQSCSLLAKVLRGSNWPARASRSQ